MINRDMEIKDGVTTFISTNTENGVINRTTVYNGEHKEKLQINPDNSTILIVINPTKEVKRYQNSDGKLDRKDGPSLTMKEDNKFTYAEWWDNGEFVACASKGKIYKSLGQQSESEIILDKTTVASRLSSGGKHMHGFSMVTTNEMQTAISLSDQKIQDNMHSLLTQYRNNGGFLNHKLPSSITKNGR